MNKVFTDNGWKDYVYWQTEDRKTLKKIKFDGVVSLETCAVCEKLPKVSCVDYAHLAYHTITNLVK